jgi:hypothetical protein
MGYTPKKQLKKNKRSKSNVTLILAQFYHIPNVFSNGPLRHVASIGQCVPAPWSPEEDSADASHELRLEAVSPLEKQQPETARGL